MPCGFVGGTQTSTRTPARTTPNILRQKSLLAGIGLMDDGEVTSAGAAPLHPNPDLGHICNY